MTRTNRNYLNFFGIDGLEKPIYRVISCDRFIEMLRASKNTLVRPKMWDDPFENFILSGVAVTSDGTKARIGFRDDLYGQCWSLHIETDAMWRIYSPSSDKCGVKLKTTIVDLFSSLYDCDGKFRDVSCFVGKVRYLTKAKIATELSSVNITDPSGVGIVQTLLIKRRAFAPEREVRLIYFNQDRGFTGDIFRYSIDPNTLFQEAVLDPRLSEHNADDWKQKFRNAGFTKRVIQSGLYKPPKGIFVNVP